MKFQIDDINFLTDQKYQRRKIQRVTQINAYLYKYHLHHWDK